MVRAERRVAPGARAGRVGVAAGTEVGESCGMPGIAGMAKTATGASYKGHGAASAKGQPMAPKPATSMMCVNRGLACKRRTPHDQGLMTSDLDVQAARAHRHSGSLA